jgi:hypothetical protein
MDDVEKRKFLIIPGRFNQCCQKITCLLFSHLMNMVPPHIRTYTVFVTLRGVTVHECSAAEFKFDQEQGKRGCCTEYEPG